MENFWSNITELRAVMPMLGLKNLIVAVLNIIVQFFTLNTFYGVYIGESDLFTSGAYFTNIILCLVMCGAVVAVVLSAFLVDELIPVTILLFIIPIVCCVLANVFSSVVMIIRVIYTIIFGILGVIPSICVAIGILIMHFLSLTPDTYNLVLYIILFGTSVIYGIVLGLWLISRSIGGGGGSHYTIYSDAGDKYEVYQDW